MSQCRRGTGAHCNCSDALVGLLVSRLTAADLEMLDTAGIDVVLDSIAEARERKRVPEATSSWAREE